MGGAIEVWNKVFAEDFILDKATFLLASIIPISTINTGDNENYVMVSLNDLRKYTKFAKQGCDMLVEKGFAKWHYSDDNKKELEGIAIGTCPDFLNVSYYFEAHKRFNKASIASQRMKPGARSNVPQEVTADFTDTIAVLDTWFTRYKIFCAKANKSSLAERVFASVKKVLDKAKTGQMDAPDLLLYLDCCNAMLYDWTDIPPQNNIKLKNMAKQVLVKHNAETLINVVPYFVEHYPTFAKETYEDTNIYMLSFHIGTTLKRMQRAQGKKKPVNLKDDRL